MLCDFNYTESKTQNKMNEQNKTETRVTDTQNKQEVARDKGAQGEERNKEGD